MTVPGDDHHADLDLDSALGVALEAARIAIRTVRDTPLGAVRTKADAADPVTEVDTAVERAVRELIGTRLPGHRVVGEEYGGEAGDGPTWYCDPVDGTTNLAAGLPWTSFSLSLAVGSTPLVGVVADPWRSEILHAVQGRGCFVDDVQVPAARGDNRSRLSGGVVLTEWARHQPWPGMLELLAALAERHCTTRVMGSSTLTLAQPAAGRCTGAVVGEFHPEDHLAATLLCQEAGLAVWDESGRQQPFPAEGGLMVADPAAAEELFTLWSASRRSG
ncbi:inositol monophosphatase [Microlunatus panaciterrae]|uniref:Fructose-1,6-bisphosphatase/inositol monophosphatase family enzyme n=1 Tax=Microlunatus panaciterrae TaxID=400768 RepID=A0ABS2RLR3_9ACTN|nr:inositol monophosphatase [Microlunatus panaciterrae]MBM7799941.1 fructose-1,6-bisphosphatase/inositol monophosphatase family enzyme [Microlunatus panaciterrae]